MRNIFIDLSMWIANGCMARSERWIARSKWWVDVAAWLGGRGSLSFAEIRAARKSVK